MNTQTFKFHAANVLNFLAVVGSCIAIIAMLVMGLSYLTAHAETSPRLTPQQVEARLRASAYTAVSEACKKGEPYTYSACMVRGLQGQRLGFYELKAPVPVVDVD